MDNLASLFLDMGLVEESLDVEAQAEAIAERIVSRSAARKDADLRSAYRSRTGVGRSGRRGRRGGKNSTSSMSMSMGGSEVDGTTAKGGCVLMWLEYNS